MRIMRIFSRIEAAVTATMSNIKGWPSASRGRFLTAGFVVFAMVLAGTMPAWALEKAPLNPEFQQHQAQRQAKTLIIRTADGHDWAVYRLPSNRPSARHLYRHNRASSRRYPPVMMPAIMPVIMSVMMPVMIYAITAKYRPSRIKGNMGIAGRLPRSARWSPVS